MDLLIKDLDLPKKGNCMMVAIFSNGMVDYKDKYEAETVRTYAIRIEPHGRLIDADALVSKTKYWKMRRFDGYFDLTVNNKIVESFLDVAPTVLEATE